MADQTEFIHQLPPASVPLSGAEIVPVDVSQGGGIFQTQRTTAGAIARSLATSLVPSEAVATDAGNALVSVPNTGSGNNVLDTSPALKGVPTAPTATVGTNSAQLATTAFVLANSAPSGVVPVATRSVLTALATSVGVAFLEESQRQGVFQWSGSNLSIQVASDPNQGIYVASNSDPTGAAGAWVRDTGNTYYAGWFGTKGDTRQATCTVSITSGFTALTAVGANFTTADIGKTISVAGAVSGGFTLGTRITAVADADHCTLAATATATLATISELVTIGTNDTLALQAALNMAPGHVLNLNGLTYTTTTYLSVPSNVTIDMAQATIIPSAVYTFTNIAPDGACFRNTHFLTSTILEDHDISIYNGIFDWRVRDSSTSTGQDVAVFMRFVDRVNVENCVQYYGGDMTALCGCADTAVRFNRAYDIGNCPYDHWNSAKSAIVIGNFASSPTGRYPAQGIQFTADNTDPVTGGSSTGGDSTRVVIADNILDLGINGLNSAIILNAVGNNTTIENAVINGNYAAGTTLGIVVQGRVSNFTIGDNVVRNIHTQGILLVSGTDPSFVPNDGTISDNTLIDCGVGVGIAIDLNVGSGIIVSDNRITGTTLGVFLRPPTTNCVVEGNLITSSSSDIANSGTGNIVARPVNNPTFSGVSVFNGLPPAAYATLDLSSIIGAKRCIVILYILNITGLASTFTFFDDGNAFAGNGSGPNQCNMASTAMGMVSVITSTAGKVKWFSSISSGTVNVFLQSFVTLS